MAIVGSSKTLLVALLLGASVYTDLKSQKVPNRLLGAALALFVFADLLLEGPSIYSSVLGSIAAGVVCALPLYFVKAMAAGDAKLILVCSVLMSWQLVIGMCFYALCWGALLGVFKVLWSGHGKAFVNNLSLIIKGKKPDPQVLTAMPFTVALAFGFASALGLSHWGIQWL